VVLVNKTSTISHLETTNTSHFSVISPGYRISVF